MLWLNHSILILFMSVVNKIESNDVNITSVLFIFYTVSLLLLQTSIGMNYILIGRVALILWRVPYRQQIVGDL